MANEAGNTSEPIDATIERVRAAVPDAGQRRLDQAKEKAAELRSTVADKLHSGADQVRERSASMEIRGVSPEARERIGRAGQRVAEGMDTTADWVRTADAQKVKAGIEEQIRTRPGRSLLIALGLGFVIGRLLKGKRDV